MTASAGDVNGRLLIVDDEPLLIKFLVRVFGDRSYRIDTAGTVGDALGLLAANVYDVIITDKNMPGTDRGDQGGLEVLARARENCPLAEVILITGYPNAESAIEALKLGACDYIVKPFQPEAILSKVDEILKRRTLLDRERIAPAFHALRSAIVAATSGEIPGPEERMARFEALNVSLNAILDGLVYRDRCLVRDWETISRLAACAEELADRVEADSPVRPVVEKMRGLIEVIRS